MSVTLANVTEPKHKARKSFGQKRAIVAQLNRLGRGAHPTKHAIRQVAMAHGISVGTVYRYMRDESLQPGAPDIDSRNATSTRPRYEITISHLAVIGKYTQLTDAYSELRATRQVTCSYSTFARAARERTDPALIVGAMHGRPEMGKHRIYLRHTPPHRGHTFHIDHTQADVWVLPSHKHTTPIRPYVTTVVDGHSSFTRFFAWTGPVNGDMVAAALAEVSIETEYLGHLIGTEPEQVVLDNDGAHEAPAIRAAVNQLGWIFANTDSYSSYQNGRAERANGILATICARMPGALHSGKNRDGSPRHAAALATGIDPENVYTWNAFTARLLEEEERLNSTVKMKARGNKTRLELYTQDPTERRPLSADVARTAMMPTAQSDYIASKSGLFFRRRYYAGAGLKVGTKYLIRHFPTFTGYIEVFTLNGQHVGRFRHNEAMSREDRAALLRNRAAQDNLVAEIAENAKNERRLDAAIANAEAAEAAGRATRSSDLEGHSPALAGTDGSEKHQDSDNGESASPVLPTQLLPRAHGELHEPTERKKKSWKRRVSAHKPVASPDLGDALNQLELSLDSTQPTGHITDTSGSTEETT